MVAHLISLKLLLLANGLRRNVWQAVGLGIATLYGFGLVTACAVGLAALRFADAATAETALVLGGSALVAVWALAPIAVAGVDLTLDPARFAPYPIPRGQLLAGHALAALIGVPGLCTALVLAATTLTWTRGLAPFAASVAGAALALGLCVVVSRLVASLASELAASRRFRDGSSLVLLVPLVLLAPLVSLALPALSDVAALGGAAEVLVWTPLGAAFSAPADAAQGLGATAAAKLAIAAASLALAAWAWSGTLGRALVRPSSGGRARAARGGRDGLGLFALVPATAAGAVAARSLVYWVRDPRYGGGLIVVPLLPVVLYAASLGQDGGGGPLAGPFALSGPLVAFVLAWSISADVSYDSTAFAGHLAAGVRGRDDRWGRALALLAFGLPVTLVVTAVPFAVAGEWATFPAVLGLAVGVLLSGTGLSSVVSARYAVAVPLPGESPFKKPAGNMGLTMAVQCGGMVLLCVLAAPEVALTVLALATGEPAYGWASLAVGTVLGAALLAGGAALGGRVLDARGPELYASLVRVA
ncbi:transporter [Sinomonas mesophila]|uniref:transporter n=1 Tax=Sinomonas mesophila TaxID=1531955 RepID=UPI000985BD6A|nr:transporter [Sinomonas mesophila]